MESERDVGQGPVGQDSISPRKPAMSDRLSFEVDRQRDTSWWQRGKGLLQALRRRMMRRTTESSQDPKRGPHSTPSRLNLWLVIVLLVLLPVPIVGALLGYFSRPASRTDGPEDGAPAGISTDNAGQGTTSKPAPGKPLYPDMPAVPTSSVPQVPAPAAPRNPAAIPPPPPQATVPLRPSNPAPVVIPSPAPPPVVTTSIPFNAITYPARHEKHFGEGCSGQLTLNSSGLTFSCGDDPNGNVQVAINEIGSVDENGIRLTSGKKYHFTIPGMTKIGEQQLFTGWLSRVR